MEFQTRGLGSSAPFRVCAPPRSACKLPTSSEQASHVFKCAWYFADVSFSRSSGNSCCNSAQVILPLSPIPPCVRSLRLSGLFGSARLQELAQLHARFVQL